MYSRSGQGRFPRDLRVPKNYAGNAFRPPLADKEQSDPIFINETVEEETVAKTQEPLSKENESTETTVNTDPTEKKEEKAVKPAGVFSFPKFDISLGKMFSHGSLNIGFEELLLIGLIILIASEGKGDDLILLLILLLFIQ